MFPPAQCQAQLYSKKQHQSATILHHHPTSPSMLFGRVKRTAPSTTTVASKPRPTSFQALSVLLVTGRSTNLEHKFGLDVHKSDFSCLNCKEPMDRLVRQDRVTCLAYHVDTCGEAGQNAG